MAKGLGATMSSSSGCGAASNTKRFICGPTTASAKPALRSAATSTSKTAADHTRALTVTPDQAYFHPAAPPLGSLIPADAPLTRPRKIVQTTGSSSDLTPQPLDLTLLRFHLVCGSAAKPHPLA